MHLRPSALGRPRIVVLDQDSSTLTRLCGLIQANGYAAVGAETAAGACCIVQRDPVDLVLTTIALPDPERREWSAMLSQLDGNVPVVAMCDASSAHALDLFDAANQFGAVTVLRRPFTASTLLQVLAELLRLPGQCNAPAPPQAVHVDWPGLASASTAIH